MEGAGKAHRENFSSVEASFSDGKSQIFIDRETTRVSVHQNMPRNEEQRKDKTLEIVKMRLQEIESRAASALRQIGDLDELRAVKWSCRKCGYGKHFTRAVAVIVCDECPHCRSRDWGAQ